MKIIKPVPKGNISLFIISLAFESFCFIAENATIVGEVSIGTWPQSTISVNGLMQLSYKGMMFIIFIKIGNLK